MSKVYLRIPSTSNKRGVYDLRMTGTTPAVPGLFEPYVTICCISKHEEAWNMHPYDRVATVTVEEAKLLVKALQEFIADNEK